MPTAAPKPCDVCRALVHDGSRRCDLHKRQQWQRRPGIVKRTTGRKLQAQRHALFSREPLCRECKRLGRVTPATKRDHIKPLAEGGTDDDDNIQPLCDPCHDEKSLVEALRGRARGG